MAKVQITKQVGKEEYLAAGTEFEYAFLGRTNRRKIVFDQYNGDGYKIIDLHRNIIVNEYSCLEEIYDSYFVYRTGKIVSQPEKVTRERYPFKLTQKVTEEKEVKPGSVLKIKGRLMTSEVKIRLVVKIGDYYHAINPLKGTSGSMRGNINDLIKIYNQDDVYEILDVYNSYEEALRAS